jgi:hypothetical protein
MHNLELFRQEPGSRRQSCVERRSISKHCSTICIPVTFWKDSSWCIGTRCIPFPYRSAIGWHADKAASEFVEIRMSFGNWLNILLWLSTFLTENLIHMPDGMLSCYTFPIQTPESGCLACWCKGCTNSKHPQPHTAPKEFGNFSRINPNVCTYALQMLPSSRMHWKTLECSVIVPWIIQSPDVCGTSDVWRRDTATLDSRVLFLWSRSSLSRQVEWSNLYEIVLQSKSVQCHVAYVVLYRRIIERDEAFHGRILENGEWADEIIVAVTNAFGYSKARWLR